MERRKFLKVVTSVSVSQTLLLSLQTSALDRRVIVDGRRADFAKGAAQTPRIPRAEKISISNNGPNLVVDVEGRPGRHVLLLYRLSDDKGLPRIFIHHQGLIAPGGHLTLVVGMAGSLDVEVPFMVVTSAKPSFDEDNLGTNWFSVRIAGEGLSATAFPISQFTGRDGEHQKVILYGITPEVALRAFAPLKTIFKK